MLVKYLIWTILKTILSGLYHVPMALEKYDTDKRPVFAWITSESKLLNKNFQFENRIYTKEFYRAPQTIDLGLK